jgi:copper chaperone CopZ
VVLAAGLILGILGLLWIIAQIPRKNPAQPYRLHEDPATGFTTCDPAVVAAAVEQQINALPGVISSSAMLRGTSTAPELTAKVTVDNRADVQDVIAAIQTTVLPDLSTALETQLRRVGLQLEVDSRSQNTGAILQ